jgi:hypothetical protein
MSRLTLIFVVIGLMTRIGAQETVSVSETFDTYAASALTTTATVAGGNTFHGGTGWLAGEGWFVNQTSGSGYGGVIAVHGTGFELQTAGASSGSVGFAARQFASSFSPTDGAPVWLSFVLRTHNMVNAGLSAAVFNALELHDGDYTTAPTVWVNAHMTAGSPNVVRWRLNTFNDPANASTSATDDVDQFEVVKITGSSVSLWFNPALGASPPASPYTSISISPLSFDRVLLVGTNNTYTAIDDFRLGNSWLAVTSATMPWVTGTSPIKGTTDGNTDVTFTGRNFVGGMSAKFGANLGTSVTNTGSTSLSAITPIASAPGAVTVEVASGSESVLIPNGFTYVTPSASFPSNQTAPSILGAVRPGNEVTASPGVWNPALVNFDYEWQSATDQIGTGSGPASGDFSHTTYAVTNDLLGRWLRVKVTATGADPASAAYTPWTAVVNPKPTAEEISAMSAVGPKCGGGSGLAAMALSPLLLLLRRRRA